MKSIYWNFSEIYKFTEFTEISVSSTEINNLDSMQDAKYYSNSIQHPWSEVNFEYEIQIIFLRVINWAINFSDVVMWKHLNTVARSHWANNFDWLNTILYTIETRWRNFFVPISQEFHLKKKLIDFIQITLTIKIKLRCGLRNIHDISWVLCFLFWLQLSARHQIPIIETSRDAHHNPKNAKTEWNPVITINQSINVVITNIALIRTMPLPHIARYEHTIARTGEWFQCHQSPSSTTPSTNHSSSLPIHFPTHLNGTRPTQPLPNVTTIQKTNKRNPTHPITWPPSRTTARSGNTTRNTSRRGRLARTRKWPSTVAWRQTGAEQTIAGPLCPYEWMDVGKRMQVCKDW